MGRFDNRVAIVTGAADGIGLATVRRLSDEGARVVAVDIDENRIASARMAFGDDVFWVVADVGSDEPSHDYVTRTMERFGRVDAAVLNAGTEGRVGRIDSLPIEVFDYVFSVNVRGVWIGLSRIMSAMRPTGGAITITSSTGGMRGTVGLAPYSASKHAVIGLMKSAALEGGSSGIRVNAVHPGPTDTRMMRDIRSAQGASSEGNLSASTPLGRPAHPSEIASVIAFLCSDEASFCTGGSYLADGGVLAGRVAGS